MKFTRDNSKPQQFALIQKKKNKNEKLTESLHLTVEMTGSAKIFSRDTSLL